MPLGIQRLNAKKSQPNVRIVFIKPLKGPDEAIAQDFLERIAAQCVPIMKEHHLSVMSLEEYEPNREFVGRNFNAGEVIQLVLKARSGHWLPFDYVQMVMMHELAHCKQMNHSKAFWAVRNTYAEQMRALWSHGYTGEGLWGRGALLSTGRFEQNTIQPDEHLPEHLCGGTYRSRRRKRKANTLTWKEQKERRILKKFGANGVALGDDEAAKRRLEKGRTVAAKPRVAGSKRGRELRATAALARFDKQEKEKKEAEKAKREEVVVDDDETASGSETESGDEYEEDPGDLKPADAVDINGTRLLDGKGQGMIKVCEDENPEDQDAKQELLELQSSMRRPRKQDMASAGIQQEQVVIKDEVSEETTSRTLGKLPDKSTASRKENIVARKDTGTRRVKNEPAEAPDVFANMKAKPLSRTPTNPPPEPNRTDHRACSTCSFVNGSLSVTCEMCANVLNPDDVPGSWPCESAPCQGSNYLNAGDCGVCGICGQRRSENP